MLDWKKTLILLLFISLFAASMAWGRGSPESPLVTRKTALTMDELVDIALENQALYRKSIADEQFARYAIRGAYGAFLPRASASATYRNTRNEVESYTLFGQVFPGSKDWSHSSSWDVGITEDLFTGGSRWFGMKSARLQLENSNLNRLRTRDELVYYVKESVYYHLAAKRSLDLAEEVLEFRMESLRYARARYENGDVIELDVIQAEIDAGDAENGVLTARYNMENTCESVNFTIGAHLDSRFDIEADLTPVLPELFPDNLVSYAYTSRPDYKALQNNVIIQEQNVKIATSEYLPRAMFSAGISGSDNGDRPNRFRFLPDNDTRYYGVGISWTLFSQFQTSINRQQYVVEKRKAMWDRHLSELQIDSDIRRQWRDLTRLYDQIQVLEKNRELARRQLELEQERYRLGASSQLNLRSAQVTFIEAENNHIGRVLDFFTTLASFERDLGRPLEEAVQ